MYWEGGPRSAKVWGGSPERVQYEKTQVRKDATQKTKLIMYKKTRFPTKRPAQFGGRNFQNVLQGGGFYEASITWDPEFQSLFKINPCFLLRIKFIIGVSLIILQQQTMIQWADISDS